jgi:hypothetical protein
MKNVLKRVNTIRFGNEKYFTKAKNNPTMKIKLILLKKGLHSLYSYDG